MCLIIHKPKGKTQIPTTFIDNAERKNPHGFGIVYLDTGDCYVTEDYTKARSWLEEKRPFVAHYRYATRGKIDTGTCHPFLIESQNSWLFSNGTVANLGDKDTCDTEVVADILNDIDPDLWKTILSFTDTRFAIVDNQNKVKRYGEWHKREGVYYSKSDCFATYISYSSCYDWSYNSGKYYKKYTPKTDTKPVSKKSDPYDDFVLDNDDYGYTNAELEIADYNRSFEPYKQGWDDVDYVAVYGTLKSTKGNHKSFLSNQLFIDEGITANRYPLQKNYGLPYVYNDSGKGFQINVEVYELDDNAKRNIDQLEGIPHHYNREIIPIELNNGELINAWLYFSADNNYNIHEKMIQSY